MLDEQPVLGVFVSPHQYEWFVRGELALAADDLDAATAAFEQARLGPADDVLIVVRLAEIALRRGRIDRAEALLATARGLDPDNEAALLVEGAIAEAAADDARAIRTYEAAIAAAPRSDRGPLALSRLLTRLERSAEAIATLEALEARARGSIAAERARFALSLSREDAPSIEAATRALITRSPGERDRVLEAAHGLLATRADLALVLSDVLGHGEAREVTLRLTALARLRRVDDLAVALVEHAIAPVDAASLWLLAQEPARALEALEGAPGDVRALCVKRAALEALGRSDEASGLGTQAACAQ